MSLSYRILILTILIVASPHLFSGQDDPVIAGSKTFMASCAACHGKDASGMKIQENENNISAPDLTLISQRNNGQFPVSRIYNIIDGREVLKSHGTRAMPTWGDLFLADTIWEGCSQVEEQIVRGRMLELILFLESIQK